LLHNVEANATRRADDENNLLSRVTSQLEALIGHELPKNRERENDQGGEEQRRAGRHDSRHRYENVLDRVRELGYLARRQLGEVDLRVIRR